MSSVVMVMSKLVCLSSLRWQYTETPTHLIKVWIFQLQWIKKTWNITEQNLARLDILQGNSQSQHQIQLRENWLHTHIMSHHMLRLPLQLDGLETNVSLHRCGYIFITQNSLGVRWDSPFLIVQGSNGNTYWALNLHLLFTRPMPITLGHCVLGNPVPREH